MSAPFSSRRRPLVLLAFGAVLAAVALPAMVTRAEDPEACGPTGTAGEVVIDFESYPVGTVLDNITVPPGIRFVPEDAATTLMVVRPVWEDVDGPPPASHMLLNSPGDREWGSLDLPLNIRFDAMMDYVALSAGLMDPAEQLTAKLTAYGVDATGRRIEITHDEETLGGDGVTPVCLAVAAPGQIYEVTVNYNRPGGVLEPELIDNVVIRRSAAPPPIPGDETAPAVEIMHPVGGTVVGDAYVRLDGTATEDRELARGEVWLNGDLFEGDFGFTPTGDYTYGFFIDAIPATRLVSCGDNVLEVRAWDAAGNRGSDLVHFASRVGDLAVVSAEPVQVLYDAPLIVGKATAFRVVVDSTFPCAVDTELRLELPGDQWDTRAPGAVAGSDVVPGEWHLPDVSGPVTIPANASGFTVMLPYVAPGEADAAWDPVTHPFGKIGLLRAAPRPTSDRVTFSVQADPDGELDELDEGNNAFDSAGYHAITTRGVRIIFIAQAWDQAQFLANSRFATEADFIARLPGYAAEQMDYLIATYPVADTKVTWDIRDRLYYRADYQWYFEDHGCWIPDPGTGVVGEEQCNPCFLAMMSTSVMADESTSDAHAVALVKPWGCCGCNDSRNINAFYAEDDGALDGNVVHELGHQDGHSGDCYACTFADGRTGCITGGALACESCFADEGFWVNHWQAYDESAEYYMTCVRDPSVIWSRLSPCLTTSGAEVPAGYLDLIELLADEADPPAVVVRGTISSQGTVEFWPFLRVEQAMVDLQPDDPGTHSIVFLDGAGGVLATYGFTPEFTRYLAEPEGEAEAGIDYFSFRVAWLEDVAVIELRDAAGTVLASREVSAQTPTVHLLAPNGGEQWGRGRQVISWEGADADDEVLSYGLWLSDDGGAAWQPLALDIGETAYTVDTTAFPAGAGYLIRVRATDGVNTAVDQSDSPFTVLGPGTPDTAEAPAEPGAGEGRGWILVGAVAAALAGAALLTLGLWRRRRRRSLQPASPAE